MDQQLFPGSTVKIMTTLLALENSQLTDQVTMTATGVSGVTDGGANISANLDEVFTMEQCLYAIMLVSANDIALQVFLMRTSTPLLMTWLLLCRPPWKMKLSVPLQEPFPILSLLPTYQEASGY